ncbi:Os06g0653300 [Oryza sativa Japonica Group]|uniref:Os06g0653300 protein n=1 Tax=Oryza sativa subsp. japonica TaxID=39947 RepID=A0A0P0WZG7_ORYSJ|nr:hypothetical protein EE612_035740 [Oryza sativa]BAS98924.1 Os06g0653300 [Oryza sativa Japonica Group]
MPWIYRDRPPHQATQPRSAMVASWPCKRAVPKPELWDDAVIWEKQAVCSWKHTSVGSSISILSRAELVHKFKDMINVRLMGASPMDKFRVAAKNTP